MTMSSFGKISLLSKKNMNTNEESLPEDEEPELKNFEAIATIVVHQNRVIAKEEQYCISLQEHLNESENKKQKLQKEIEEVKQNLKIHERREQILIATRNRLEESLRTCRIKLNEYKKEVENKNVKRKSFLLHISNVSEKHEKMFRNFKSKYPEELSEENERLYMKLENLQGIRNQLKNNLNTLQTSENTQTYDWNLWKEQVIRVAELLKPTNTQTRKNSLSPFVFLMERKKLGCQTLTSSPSDRSPTIEVAKEKNFSALQTNNINNQSQLRPTENLSVAHQSQRLLPQPTPKLSEKKQISSPFKLSMLNLPTLKVPTFKLFRNVSSFAGKKGPNFTSSGINKGELPKVQNPFLKGQVNDVRDKTDLEKQSKQIVAGNDVHCVVEEEPPQRPVEEKNFKKGIPDIGKDLRVATKDLPGKSLQHKNLFKTFNSSFSVLKGPRKSMCKASDDTPSFIEANSGSKSTNFTPDMNSQKDIVHCQEEVKIPSEERSKNGDEEIRDLHEVFNASTRSSEESTEVEVCSDRSNSVDVPEGNKITGDSGTEIMEVTEREITEESNTNNMELTTFKNSMEKPICNSENKQNSDENLSKDQDYMNKTNDDFEMEVSTSEVPEENDVVMTSPSLHNQPLAETFNSQFSFSLYDQQEDFMGSFSQKGNSFSLYSSPNPEQGESKNDKDNAEGPSFLFGMMGSSSPSENTGFSFSFQGGTEDIQPEESSTSKTSNDFFSLFSSTDHNIQTSQPNFSLF